MCVYQKIWLSLFFDASVILNYDYYPCFDYFLHCCYYPSMSMFHRLLLSLTISFLVSHVTSPFYFFYFFLFFFIFFLFFCLKLSLFTHQSFNFSNIFTFQQQIHKPQTSNLKPQTSNLKPHTFHPFILSSFHPFFFAATKKNAHTHTHTRTHSKSRHKNIDPFQ